MSSLADALAIDIKKSTINKTLSKYFILIINHSPKIISYNIIVYYIFNKLYLMTRKEY